MDATTAAIPVMVYINVELDRERLPRLCPVCRRKRVMVGIAILDPGGVLGGRSTARCAECWGIRRHER